MTVAADLGTCTWASCREKAITSTTEGWNFCDEHSAADTALKAEQDHIVRRPAHQPLPRPATPLTAVPVSNDPRATAIAPTAAAASPIGRLLEDASQHSRPAVRTLASRIERNLDQLRALIAEHQATEAARRAEAEAKEKAKAEVARLEAQLAAAKAKLRGNRPAPTRTVTAAGPEGGFPCRKCSKPIATPQGRGNHEKHCTAGAS